MEIRPRPPDPSVGPSREELGDVDDPAAGRGERVARRERGTVHVEPGAVDRTERRVEAEALLAEHRVLPGLQRGEHLRGERLVDLVEVEVLQGQPLALEHPRDGVGGGHQQPLAAVHVVHRGSLVRRQVGQRLVAVLLGPRLRREQHHRGAVGERRGVAGGHRGGLALAEDRLEPAESFSTEESGRRFWSRSSPRNGVTWSSRNPAYAAARCWCDAAAARPAPRGRSATRGRSARRGPPSTGRCAARRSAGSTGRCRPDGPSPARRGGP